jgi:hypothetical protein
LPVFRDRNRKHDGTAAEDGLDLDQLAGDSLVSDVSQLIRMLEQRNSSNAGDRSAALNPFTAAPQACAGVPAQRLDGNRTYLEIPLLRGDWLVVDPEGRTVSVR